MALKIDWHVPKLRFTARFGTALQLQNDDEERKKNESDGDLVSDKNVVSWRVERRIWHSKSNFIAANEMHRHTQPLR